MAGCVTRAVREASASAERESISYRFSRERLRQRQHYLRWLKLFFRLEIEQLANDRKLTTKLSLHEGILEYCYRR
jgi:hypothetical protein